MTPEALVDTLRDAGIRLTVTGDRLHVEAPRGRYTPDLRARLIEHKATLLPWVAMRDRLRGVARTIGVPDRIVTELPASELRACVDQLPLWDGQTDEQGNPLARRVLEFYLRGLAEPRPPESTPTSHAGAHHD